MPDGRPRGITPGERDFHAQIIATLPALQRQARGLTRNRDSADDLVQEAVCAALAAQHTYAAGTNFTGWMRTILRNRFISRLRKMTERVGIEDYEIPIAASQALTVEAHETIGLMMQLPPPHFDALARIMLTDVSYEDLAALQGAAVGTAKSRVFRAREMLNGNWPYDSWRRSKHNAAINAAALRKIMEDAPCAA